MPASYTIDTARRVVLSRLCGVLTLADLAALRARLRADPAADRAFDRLADCRGLTRMDVSAQDVKQLADGPAPRSDTRLAIVADTAAAYGLARMYQMHREGKEAVEVFRDLDDAQAWLGLND